MKQIAWLINPAVLTASALLSCTLSRDVEPLGGVHPAGWADDKSAAFHGTALRNTGFPLADCRACHGDDYAGGAVSSTCTSANCHAQGVEWCGTCHDGSSTGRPLTGLHTVHEPYCNECHVVPMNARSSIHPNGHVDVMFLGLAVHGGVAAEWDPATRRCTNVYCHQGTSLSWEQQPTPVECDGCHQTPPDSHLRWTSVSGLDQCVTCHAVGEGDWGVKHINGIFDVSGDIACNTCHGQGPLGAPPPALDGSTSVSAAGVGAHQRHLDETLANRIGRVLKCEDCHTVPQSITQAGHLDETAPADVTLKAGGSYDASTGQCVSACHWDRNPGPVWTDETGAERACDACHDFPPDKTRTGTPHPQVAPTLSACLLCHPFDPQRHVDGHVDFLP